MMKPTLILTRVTNARQATTKGIVYRRILRNRVQSIWRQCWAI
ncbi:hypothetical protein WMF27_03985 [Sorangium sp. So ce281]